MRKRAAENYLPHFGYANAIVPSNLISVLSLM